MPYFMDIHEITEGVTDDDLAEAHLKDIAFQEQFGVKSITYWRNEEMGHSNCLLEAPSVEQANALHQASHGLAASDVIEVDKAVVEAFMGRIDQTPAALDPATTDPGSALRIIFFTDMVGSTAMTQKLGDDAALNILENHDTTVRSALQKHGGREVKHTGDGIMASFASVTGSVHGAIEVQRSLNDHNQANPDQALHVRIGLCAGEPVEKDKDLFGASVQLAARICDYAQAGEIRVTRTVQELCLGKGFRFDNPQAVTLKGFEEPIKIATVMWR
ncbi:MAG: nickel-binding protein [Candidatus Neomarinimicrobiota bacterium]